MDRIAQDKYVERVAREKGLAEGRAEGRKKGLVEGRAEGEARKQCEIANALKTAGELVVNLIGCPIAAMFGASVLFGKVIASCGGEECYAFGWLFFR